MTQAISGSNVTSFAGELAVLLLEQDANQIESAHLERQAARESYLANAQQQVEALHDAATATMTGAFVSAAFTIGGAALTVSGAVSKYDADMNAAKLEAIKYDPCQLDVANELKESIAAAAKAATISTAAGAALGNLAGAAQSIVGDSAAKHFQAEAKRYEILGAQAQWQSSDAGDSADKAEARANKMLDLLQSIQSDENSSANALIGRI